MKTLNELWETTPKVKYNGRDCVAIVFHGFYAVREFFILYKIDDRRFLIQADGDYQIVGSGHADYLPNSEYYPPKQEPELVPHYQAILFNSGKEYYLSNGIYRNIEDAKFDYINVARLDDRPIMLPRIKK